MAITIIIDETEYTAVKNPQFAPQVDLVGNSLPTNEFQIDIVTDDTVTAGQPAEFRWNGTLWARYWVDYAERTDENTVHIRARSEIALLDGVTLEEAMYDAAPLADVLDGVMVTTTEAEGLDVEIDYALSSALSSATVTGYCPEQTARERLQWVCFAVGAYVKTAFVDKITILPLDSTPALIPLESTFWRPAVEHREYVTAIRLTAYTFTQDADAAQDAHSYTFPLPWVAQSQVFELKNTSVPAGIQDNPFVIDELYLINPQNVSALLNLLAARYFTRTTVQLDALNEGAFAPGDRVDVYAGAESLYEGYLESASFRFGKSVRASMAVTAAEELTGARLRVIYMADEVQIGEQSYFLPVGYAYSISNPYLDITSDGHRRIYRPTTAAITGTLPAGGATVTVYFAVALDLYDGVLSIISVDDAQRDTDNESVVIA